MLCTVNNMEELETKLRKEISDIKFVFSLMRKHDTASVPTNERNKITDIDIVILCECNEMRLLELLKMNEACTRQQMLITNPSNINLFVLLHYFLQSPKYAML